MSFFFFFLDQNLAPIVYAGDDQSGPVGDFTISDATASDDGGPGALSYLWTKTSGPAGDSIANATTLSPTITTISEGTYVYRLTVSDTALTSFDEMTIVVSNSGAPVYKTKWRWIKYIREFLNRIYRRQV